MPSFVEFSKKFIMNAEKHQEDTNKRLDALEASSEILKGKLQEILEKQSAREKGKLPGATERTSETLICAGEGGYEDVEYLSYCKSMGIHIVKM